MMDERERLIVALDVPSFEEAEKIVKSLGDEVIFYKVGLQLYTSAGPQVIKYLKELGKKVFLDLKLHDIPNTVAETVSVASSYNVDMMTIHTFGGFEMMEVAQKRAWKPDGNQAILLGVIASVFIILLDVFVFMGAQASAQEMHISTPPWWKGLLASFYGAINEEVFARLFLISLIVFLTQKILKRKTDEPTEYVIWMAIGLSSVLFGLGHLPATLSAGIPLNYFIVVRAIVLNSIAAIPFGWLYWKKSLAAAMSAHFTADIVLHVLLPLAAAG